MSDVQEVPNNEEEISSLVDELTNRLDADYVAKRATNLGLTVDELMGRVMTELNARISG